MLITGLFVGFLLVLMGVVGYVGGYSDGFHYGKSLEGKDDERHSKNSDKDKTPTV